MFLEDKSQELEKLIELRKENTRMRLEQESSRNLLKKRETEVCELKDQVREIQEKQKIFNKKIFSLWDLVGMENVEETDILWMLDQIQTRLKKIIKEKQPHKYPNEQSPPQFKPTLQQKNQTNQYDLLLREKSEEIDRVQRQNKKLEGLMLKNQHKNQQNQQLLGEYANKISSLEVELKEQKSTQENSIKKSETIKKECLAMMQGVCVKNDDYLKSYLLKNNRYQNGYSPISKKNKHNFIFYD